MAERINKKPPGRPPRPQTNPIDKTVHQTQENQPQVNTEPSQTNIEYLEHVIVTEPHGRVMVTKNGLHVTEFIGDIDQGIKQAKEHIDNACK